MTLTAGGWTVMLLSLGTVLAIVVYCVGKVLSLPPVDLEDLKGPLDIDTGDTTDAD